MAKSTTHKIPPTKQDFPVVGIGASAGGLDAFKKLVEKIPERSGMAYVLVTHLSPDYESTLAEIISRSTNIPVFEITDEINIAPDNIYIIPEDKTLTSLDGALMLTPRDHTEKKNLPINAFFQSLAETHESFAIGVVLSGTGFDGTDGLKSIKEFGGVTYAQDNESASFDSMPSSAVNSGAVDFVLPPEQIPEHLLNIILAYKNTHAFYPDDKIPEGQNDVYKQIITILKVRTGNDFSRYKQATLRRRLARRIVATKKKTPGDYLKLLRSSVEEQEALFNDILIPVSYFFRDEAVFNSLCQNVFPRLMDGSIEEGQPFRVWVAGCSTGEEAYSLAICLNEYLEEHKLNYKVQIFATDISARVINKARVGMFSAQEVESVSSSRLRNYFTKIDGTYHISKSIRDMCVFAIHNFLQDPPFARMDIISCRNVLIYFDASLQKRALNTFHYSLRDNGVLFLGKSETANAVPDLFNLLDKTGKIYTRKSSVVKGNRLSEMPDPIRAAVASTQIAERRLNGRDIQKLAEDILLTRYTPAGVIINEQHQIVNFHGDTSPFLVPSPGKPDYSILKMAREGISFALRKALLKLKTENGAITSDKISIKNQDYLASFEIIPIVRAQEPFYLVLFIKHQPIEKNVTKENRADDQRVKLLEAELQQLRIDIQLVNEDHEAAHEELQSAHEALLSTNEELQSLNEELETSSEELQSTNEELISMNDELIDRQEQLVTARLYAEAIVETVREPLLIVDRHVRIISANSSFYQYFNATEKDLIGRNFFDLNNGQWNTPELRNLLENELPDPTKIQGLEITGDFGSGRRTLILNARKLLNENNGELLLLLAIDDITERNNSKLLRESDERFTDLANTTPVMMWMSGPDKKNTFVNKSWLDFTGKTLEQEIEENCASGIFHEDSGRVAEVFNKAFDTKGEYNIEYRLQRHDGEYRWISCKGIPRFADDGEFLGYIGGCMDIQDQKDFNQSLEDKVAQRTREFQESESFLQSILNTTQNLIYVYDFEKERVIFVNKKALESTGHTPEQHQAAKDRDLFTEQIHPDDLEHVKIHRDEIRGNLDGEMKATEFRLKNSSGEYAYQMSRDLVFKRDENGNPTQYIGVATDISDIRHANESLKSKNQELQYSNVELASFSSIASHDLKEPLRKIQLFGKLVLAADKMSVSEDSLHFLERIIKSADRMQQLIDDLISYSRTSREKIKFVETDLNHLLNEVMEDLKEMIEQNNAKIEIPDLPFLFVLPSQFRQLFLNLISNSIKYSKGGVNPIIIIESTVATTDEIRQFKGNPEVQYYKFTLTDNGIGFPEEYKETIFEPFKRLHSKDEYNGTGIGLAICKKIMLNHKGFITASSTVGEGSVFSIFVPDRRRA